MHRRLPMKILLLPFLLVPSLVPMGGCDRSTLGRRSAQTVIRIAEGTFPASAAVYVAHDSGFFRDEGLADVIQRYGSGRLALEAVLGGKADFATVAETPIARAVLDGRAPVVVATICEVDRASVIIARKDRGIAAADDLRGRRIGVLSGTAADFFLHIYLVTSGIDTKAVTIVPLKADDIVPALLGGRVDAVSVFAPYTVQLLDKLGANAVTLDQPGLYSQSWNIAVDRPDARTNRDVTVRFLRAILRANDYIASHRSEAQAIAAKGTGIPVAGVRKEWPSYRWAMKLDQTLILSLEDEYRWMTGTEAVPNFLDYVDSSALRVVRPDAVRLVEPKE